MHYLTNTALHNKARTILAAQNSGLDIRFEPNPMPVDAPRFAMFSDPDADRIYASVYPSLVGQYGCVVSYEGYRDLSAFWDAWDALQ